MKVAPHENGRRGKADPLQEEMRKRVRTLDSGTHKLIGPMYNSYVYVSQVLPINAKRTPRRRLRLSRTFTCR